MMHSSTVDDVIKRKASTPGSDMVPGSKKKRMSLDGAFTAKGAEATANSENRNPQTRRQTIAVARRTSPRRKGLWDANVLDDTGESSFATSTRDNDSIMEDDDTTCDIAKLQDIMAGRDPVGSNASSAQNSPEMSQGANSDAEQDDDTTIDVRKFRELAHLNESAADSTADVSLNEQQRRATASPSALAAIQTSAMLDESSAIAEQDQSCMNDTSVAKRSPGKTGRRQTASPQAIGGLLDALDEDESTGNINHQSPSDRRETIDTTELSGLTEGLADESSSAVPTSKRTTASPTDLMALLEDDTLDESAFDAVKQVAKPTSIQSNSMPENTESDSAAPPVKSAVKSVLKKSGKFESAVKKKAVVFGSPDVAEFNFRSPTAHLTPMPKHSARHEFPIEEDEIAKKEQEMDEIYAAEEAREYQDQCAEEDEATKENSKILNEFDDDNDGSSAQSDTGSSRSSLHSSHADSSDNTSCSLNFNEELEDSVESSTVSSPSDNGDEQLQNISPDQSQDNTPPVASRTRSRSPSPFKPSMEQSDTEDKTVDLGTVKSLLSQYEHDESRQHHDSNDDDSVSQESEEEQTVELGSLKDLISADDGQTGPVNVQQDLSRASMASSNGETTVELASLSALMAKSGADVNEHSDGGEEQDHEQDQVEEHETEAMEDSRTVELVNLKDLVDANEIGASDNEEQEHQEDENNGMEHQEHLQVQDASDTNGSCTMELAGLKDLVQDSSDAHKEDDMEDGPGTQHKDNEIEHSRTVELGDLQSLVDNAEDELESPPIATRTRARSPSPFKALPSATANVLDTESSNVNASVEGEELGTSFENVEQAIETDANLSAEESTKNNSNDAIMNTDQNSPSPVASRTRARSPSPFKSAILLNDSSTSTTTAEQTFSAGTPVVVVNDDEHVQPMDASDVNTSVAVDAEQASDANASVATDPEVSFRGDTGMSDDEVDDVDTDMDDITRNSISVAHDKNNDSVSFSVGGITNITQDHSVLSEPAEPDRPAGPSAAATNMLERIRQLKNMKTPVKSLEVLPNNDQDNGLLPGHDDVSADFDVDAASCQLSESMAQSLQSVDTSTAPMIGFDEFMRIVGVNIPDINRRQSSADKTPSYAITNQLECDFMHFMCNNLENQLQPMADQLSQDMAKVSDSNPPVFVFAQRADDATRSVLRLHLQSLLSFNVKAVQNEFASWELEHVFGQLEKQVQERIRVLSTSVNDMDQIVSDQTQVVQTMDAASESLREYEKMQALRDAVGEQDAVVQEIEAEVRQLEEELQQLQQSKTRLENDINVKTQMLEQNAEQMQMVMAKQAIVTELQETTDVLMKFTLWRLCEESDDPNEIMALSVTHPDKSVTKVIVSGADSSSNVSATVIFTPAPHGSSIVASLVESARCDEMFRTCSTKEECLRVIKTVDLLFMRIHSAIMEIAELERQSSVQCSCLSDGHNGVSVNIKLTHSTFKSQLQLNFRISAAYPCDKLNTDGISVVYGNVDLARAQNIVAQCLPGPKLITRACTALVQL